MPLFLIAPKIQNHTSMRLVAKYKSFFMALNIGMLIFSCLVSYYGANITSTSIRYSVFQINFPLIGWIALFLFVITAILAILLIKIGAHKFGTIMLTITILLGILTFLMYTPWTSITWGID